MQLTKRWLGMLFLVFGLSWTATARADDTADALEQAKQVHAKARQAAGEELRKQFDPVAKEVAASGELARVKEILAQQKAFEEKGTLPGHPGMAPHVEKYQQALRQANQKLEAAYDQAIRSYTRQFKIEQAEALQKEKLGLNLAASSPKTSPVHSNTNSNANVTASPTLSKLPVIKDTGQKEVDVRKAGGSYTPDQAADQSAKYLVIPIQGQFGTEVVGAGVEKCLEFAKLRKIRHIVFLIDSPGGAIREAEQIRQAMNKYSEDLVYHALIERAISASIWVVFGCDTVHMKPGGTVGGAVVYSQNLRTGNAQVDAKMNSIITADLTAMAEKHDHVGLLIPPMILQKATLYAWRSGSTKVAFGEKRPAGASDDDLIIADTGSTVLTLTHEQAVAIGLARPLQGGPEALGASLGLTDWTDIGPFGKKFMETAQARQRAMVAAIKGRIEKFKTEWQKFRDMCVLAHTEDPYRGHYTLADPTHFTPESRKQWQRQTDIAISAWKRAQSKLTAMEREQAALKRLGMPEDIISESDMEVTRDRIKNNIKKLMRERNRQGK